MSSTRNRKRTSLVGDPMAFLQRYHRGELEAHQQEAVKLLLDASPAAREALAQLSLKDRFPWPAGFEKPRGRFSQKHWREQARRLFADCLLRASVVDTRSPVGAMVEKRILDILRAEDPEAMNQAVAERDRFVENLGRVMQSMMPDRPRKRRKTK